MTKYDVRRILVNLKAKGIITEWHSKAGTFVITLNDNKVITIPPKQYHTVDQWERWF